MRGLLRLVAFLGMVGVLLLAVWLFLLACLTRSGVFENQEPDDYARADRLLVIAVAAAVGAVAWFIGVMSRRRILAMVGAIAVSGCALIVLLDWLLNDWRLGSDDTDFVALALGVILVGLLALWSAFAYDAD